LNHIREKSFWESAAYDFFPYCNVFNSGKEAIHKCLLYDAIVPEMEDELLQNWWDLLSDEWKLVFNLNQNRGEYRPIF
jgi:hypothetical protein